MLGHVAVGTWSGGRFMRFGEPIRVPSNADRAAQEAVRKDVESALRALNWQVDEEAVA